MNTTYQEVVDSFESSFQDKVVIPDSLIKVWFNKAVGKYSYEIENIIYDDVIQSFDRVLDRYVIDYLATLMKQYYQERELSKVNKRISIVGKDLSIDGSNGSKTAALNELNYINSEAEKMKFNQIPTALI